MKKYLYSVWAKIIALLLCVVFAVGLGVNLAGTIICSVLPVREEAENALYEELGEQYAAKAIDLLSKENWKEELDALAGSINMDFGIIKTHKVGDVFLETDEEFDFVYKTTDKLDVSYENAEGGVYKTDVGRYRTDSLLGALWAEPFSYRADAYYNCLEIEDLVYDTNTKLFFYKTSIGYILRTDLELTVSYKEDDYDYAGFIEYSYDENAKTYDSAEGIFDLEFLKDKKVSLYLGAKKHTYTSYDQVKIVELPEEELIYTSNSYSTENGSLVNYVPDEHEEPVYWVICQPKAELEHQDLFAEVSAWLDKFYNNANYYVINQVICLLLSLFFLGVLLYSAGRNPKEEGVMLGVIDRIPYEIILLVVGLLELGAAFLIYLLAEAAITGQFNSELHISIAIEVAALMFATLIGVFYTTAARIKARSFWKTTLVFPILKWCFTALKTIWKWATTPFCWVYDGCRKHLGLAFKVFFGWIVVCLVEFVILFSCCYDAEAMAFSFILLKGIEIPVLIVIVIQMKRLQDGSARVAAGDTQPIDTKGMIWEFKKHAENINKVGDGMQLAMEEQLKSERFRTELITNVSHDIKTPLTSIINYVDLIQKEEITDPTLVEYVEVLDRQSARLKKLIEDLMEASKASTGNLTVNREDCDLAVMLTQTVGEFQEKLEANQLDLVVNSPQPPVVVVADSRHLWRVFDNLLNNICKYSQPNTRVYVDLKVYDAVADIYFKNISRFPLNITGDELMERFVRGDSSRNTEGSGLGLSIAQSLTELMQGHLQITVDGDLFKVRLRFPLKK